MPNPYWDAVQPYVVQPSRRNPVRSMLHGHSPTIGDMTDVDLFTITTRMRHDLVRRYSWAVTDPSSVAFVAGHSQGHIIDPMAGTGYWSLLLARLDVTVRAFDRNPPAEHSKDNPYHHNTRQHCAVHQADVTASVSTARPGETLFLSWPPYNDNTAEQALIHYPGDKVIYIGEGLGGCTGNDAFHERLDKEWNEIDHHLITQWAGLHDTITVLTRKNT